MNLIKGQKKLSKLKHGGKKDEKKMNTASMVCRTKLSRHICISEDPETKERQEINI